MRGVLIFSNNSTLFLKNLNYKYNSYDYNNQKQNHTLQFI